MVNPGHNIWELLEHREKTQAVGPHFLWHGRLTTKSHEPSEQLSTIWDPPWAGWTADVATATHFREIWMQCSACIRQNSEKNYHSYSSFHGNCKIFWFAEHKQSQQNTKLLQIQNLQPFFSKAPSELEGTVIRQSCFTIIAETFWQRFSRGTAI